MDSKKRIERHQVKTAILVDGGFYRKRAIALWGKESPENRANELNAYCYKHLNDNRELPPENNAKQE